MPIAGGELHVEGTILRTSDPEALAGLAPGFDAPKLNELLFRYRARNWPETQVSRSRPGGAISFAAAPWR